MKKISTLLLFSLLCFLLHSQEGNLKPKIAIAGLAIESSVFSPARTSKEDFHATYGEEIYRTYPFLSPDSSLINQANWIPILTGHALPGGTVTREAYDSLMSEMLKSLAENLPYDGLYFDIHGAMTVEGIEDAEGDMIKKIREVIGYKTLISTSMDLHGNVSRQLAHETDLITCYRLAPHEDALETKERAVVNLVNRIKSGKGKPFKAWVPIPILLPGEKTSTRIEPGKSLYNQIEPLTEPGGVIDAAIWVGYAWGDEPRNHAVAMAVGDNKAEVAQVVEKLATSFWDKKEEFEFVAPTTTFSLALTEALESPTHPFLISDMGDNPTAGGSGDVSWTLEQLLKDKERISKHVNSLVYASIPGPELIKEALEKGVGAMVSANVGALIDQRYAPPIMLEGIVTVIKKGDKHAKTEVVIKTGSIYVIVTEKRKPYHHLIDFIDLGINPNESDVIIVKIGYLVPELFEIQKGWVMALTPGGVDQDLKRVPYKKIKRPMFPLDKKIENPNLKARFIPKSGE